MWKYETVYRMAFGSRDELLITVQKNPQILQDHQGSQRFSCREKYQKKKERQAKEAMGQQHYVMNGSVWKRRKEWRETIVRSCEVPQCYVRLTTDDYKT